MNKIIPVLMSVICINQAIALPIETEYAIDLNNYYGYTNYAGHKNYTNKQNNFNASLNLYGSLIYNHTEKYFTSLVGYFMLDSAKEIENYNQGKWGEEIYLIHENPYGRIQVGQSYNVAYEFGVGAPSVGSWSADNSDLANFLTTSNWYKKGSHAEYKTLNSTYINTDGASPKVSYISPEFLGIEAGISYIPKTYSQTGLVSKYSEYKDDEAYVLGAYGNWDISGYEVETSLGFADFHDNDKEYSAGLSIYRKGWTVGGSYRQSEVDKKDYHINQKYDGYRDAKAYNLGISYEIGPFESGISYFNSKTNNNQNYDKIISFSNRYQYNKYSALSFTMSHLKSKDESIDKTTKGYAFILGLEINL